MADLYMVLELQGGGGTSVLDVYDSRDKALAAAKLRAEKLAAVRRTVNEREKRQTPPPPRRLVLVRLDAVVIADAGAEGDKLADGILGAFAQKYSGS